MPIDTNFKQALTYKFDMFTKYLDQLSYASSYLVHLSLTHVIDHVIAYDNYPKIYV